MDAQRGIARRMVIGLPREGLSPAWEKDFAAYVPAGVILFRRDFRDLEELRRLTWRLRDLARPRRIWFGIDEEGGFVSQLGGHLVVPPNARLLARGAAPGDIEWASRVTGERLRALGIDWVFAPVADIDSEPLNPVIGPRSFATDAAGVTACVGEAVRGFRAARIASCLKHFPGHGDTVVDSHLALPANDANRQTLEARELVPFRAHLDADSMMSAHLVTRALDPERPGTYSRAVVHDLLRGTLRFEGVCVTDALEMKGAAAGRSAADAGRLALGAGCDLLLYAFHDEAVRRARLELAKDLVEGRIDRAAFDAARPRLARMDAAVPPPGPDDYARTIDSLTPEDWLPRLEAIIERGIRVTGHLRGAVGPWHVHEPAHDAGTYYGPSLGEELRSRGVEITPDPARAGVSVEVDASRVPPKPERIEDLRRICREKPTILIALQSDAILSQVPESAVSVSACDPTPITRRVVAGRLADLRVQGA